MVGEPDMLGLVITGETPPVTCTAAVGHRPPRLLSKPQTVTPIGAESDVYCRCMRRVTNSAEYNHQAGSRPTNPPLVTT